MNSTAASVTVNGDVINPAARAMRQLSPIAGITEKGERDSLL
jgi:hypothetical protein